MSTKPNRHNFLRALSFGGNKWIAPALLFAFIVVPLLAFGAVAANGMANQNGISRGVTIANIDVGGMSSEDARHALVARINEVRVAFTADDIRIETIPSGGSDKKPYAAFDIDNAIAAALRYGKSDNTVRDSVAQLRAMAIGSDIPLSVALDRAALRALLEAHFSGVIVSPRDASIVVATGDDGARATVVPERRGRIPDFNKTFDAVENALRGLDNRNISLDLDRVEPRIVAADVQPLIDAAQTAVSRAPLTLAAAGETWTVSQSLLADWITAVPGETSGATLAIDKGKTETFLRARSSSVSSDPKEAVFEMKDGKVAVFSPAVPGKKLDADAAVVALAAAAFGDGATRIDVPFIDAPPNVATADANPYGIQEIIGIGESNFAGSPKNRRINIAVGARSVDGTLVAPDEEFSLLKTLGKIDGAHGYLQELVIKENKTTPEYGGGLCQIGSTTFRAVLASGLPVTERRNHSYRVPYYERDGKGKFIGPGKDATIYDPAPDFKFKNDTGAHILIRTEIEKDTLRFIFWGRQDGRTAEQTDSIVTRIVPPPEKKLIETTNLAPGVTKCTEKPHAGSDAVFTYTVTYPDGTVAKKDFFSRYRPWGEVCLVGVDPNAPKPPADAGATPPSADATGATGT